METAVKKFYEGMFLIDSAEAARDWEGIIELISKMLTRAEAEIISIRKWDERPLAYTIRRCSRGTYILAYFRAEGPKIRDIERDVRLSDRIMRALILKADHLTEQDIAKETPATRSEKQIQQAAEKPPTLEVNNVKSEEIEQAEEPVAENGGDESQATQE